MMELSALFLCLLSPICILSCVYCYTLGVRHGRIAANGGVPRVQNPVEAVQEAVHKAEERKEAKEQETELGFLFSASRESMIKAMQEERDRRTGRA
jgi:hypothetical protein